MSMHDILDRIIQRYALAMLYFSFHGSDWYNCSNDRNVIHSSTSSDECVDSNGMAPTRFLDSSHECEWFGVACSTNTTDMDADAYYPITNLELSSNNLYGSIPEEISLLYTLKVLDLRDNHLTGNIPFGAFATMDELDTLLLSGNDDLYGDASRYCQSSSLSDMSLFETDCTPVVEELKPAPVQCSCCTSCTK